MKTLYFECNMGAAGDMLMAALLELHENPEDFLERLNAIGIPGVVVSTTSAVKHGITGTHVSVKINGQEEHPGTCEHHIHDQRDEGYHKHYEQCQSHKHGYSHQHNYSHERGHNHEHSQSPEYGHGHEHGYSHEHSHSHEHGHNHDHENSHGYGHSSEDSHSHEHSHTHDDKGHAHNSYHDIEDLINHLKLSDEVKNNVLAVYKLIAEAESHAHGVSVEQIHFHEVGDMDAVADIVGVCMLIEELAPEQILASPINVGSGQVRCAHGILPVPAPATIHILQGVPIYSDEVVGELCTPTGAALLKHYVEKFSKIPLMSVNKLGYGMGTKDFEKANCVRAFLGEIGMLLSTDMTSEAVAFAPEVVELVCNIDDMTSEALAFAQEQLLAKGAPDVYITPIVMKKNRAGFQFTCMCQREDVVKMIALIFKHTTTLGIREIVSRRYTLKREQIAVDTKYGTVKMKKAHGFGVEKCKPEYEDVARIAREQGIALGEVHAELTKETS